MSARDLPPELLAQTWAGLPRELRASVRASVARGLEALKAPEPLTLHQWAERHFYLSAESSQGAKKWVAYPYQRGMLCMMGDDWIAEVDLMKSARVGYTKCLLASVAFNAQHKRRNQCIWQPTDADSDEFCKSEVEPMLRDVRVMAAVFPEMLRKSKANTLNMKRFLGSLLFLKGGTSAGNYRRMTLQTFHADEFSQFDDKIEGSADPWTLMWKRLEGATYKKAVVGSTPRVAGRDHTERRFKAALARMRFHISCPHCGVEHPLLPGQLHPGAKDAPPGGMAWDMADPEGTVHHVCPHCLGHITQADYLSRWEAGLWVSECGNYRCHALADGAYFWTDGAGMVLDVPPRHVGLHIWSAYSEQVGWAELVREFLEADAAKRAGHNGPMEGYINETLGLTTADEVQETDAGALRRRAEPYPLGRVPRGGVKIVMGVDTQDAWWAVHTVAVGRGGEMWVVGYEEISGDPGNRSDWETVLLPVLRRVYHHWDGAPMRADCIGLDCAGSHWHEAVAFCKRHEADKVYGLKGEALPDKPIKSRMKRLTINTRGKTVLTGEKVWFVGTATAKDVIYSRLQFKPKGPGVPAPGFIHFSRDLDQRYYDGLTAEVKRKKYTRKGAETYWDTRTPGARNEPLDTMVYALWCCERMGYTGWGDRQWQLHESALVPDLFLASEAPAAPHVGPASGAPVLDVLAVPVADAAGAADAPSAAGGLAGEAGADGEAAEADEAAKAGQQQALDLPAPPRTERIADPNTPNVSLFDIAYGP